MRTEKFAGVAAGGAPQPDGTAFVSSVAMKKDARFGIRERGRVAVMGVIAEILE